MNPHPLLQQELTRFALLLAAAAIGGVLFGALGLFVSIATSGYLLITLLQLSQLERRLASGAWRPGHDAPAGLWRAIDEHLQDSAERGLRRRRAALGNLRAFRAATAAIPDAIVALDAGWEIRWANPAAQLLLGLELPRDHGQRIGNLVRNPSLNAALADPTRLEPIEMVAPRDPTRWLNIVLVSYGAGEHLLIARDATRIRRLEQMRREFVANASHELRSPLTVISGYLEAMHDDQELATAWHGPLAEMRRQTDRMAGIVDDLLELSRLETDPTEPTLEPIDVEGLLARIREEALALGTGPRHVEITVTTRCRLLGSEREVYSAVSNLVFNAMRYTPPEGRVTVRWAEDRGEGLLEIADTGIGIPAEHLPRLTERFYRVEASRVRTKGGTGLGLSIVKHVAQRHGGGLSIQSQVGKGSRFALRFPARRLAPRL